MMNALSATCTVAGSPTGVNSGHQTKQPPAATLAPPPLDADAEEGMKTTRPRRLSKPPPSTRDGGGASKENLEPATEKKKKKNPKTKVTDAAPPDDDVVSSSSHAVPMPPMALVTSPTSVMNRSVPKVTSLPPAAASPPARASASTSPSPPAACCAPPPSPCPPCLGGDDEGSLPCVVLHTPPLQKAAASSASSSPAYMGPLPVTPDLPTATTSAITAAAAEENEIVAPPPLLDVTATQPRLHPCIRVYGKCEHSDGRCRFAYFPYETCLRHLKARCAGTKARKASKRCTELHLNKEEIARFFAMESIDCPQPLLCGEEAPAAGAGVIPLTEEPEQVQNTEEKEQVQNTCPPPAALPPAAALTTTVDLEEPVVVPKAPAAHQEKRPVPAGEEPHTLHASPQGGGVDLVALTGILYRQGTCVEPEQVTEQLLENKNWSPQLVSATSESNSSSVQLGILNRTAESDLDPATTTSTASPTAVDGGRDDGTVWESPSPVSPQANHPDVAGGEEGLPLVASPAISAILSDDWEEEEKEKEGENAATPATALGTTHIHRSSATVAPSPPSLLMVDHATTTTATTTMMTETDTLKHSRPHSLERFAQRFTVQPTSSSTSTATTLPPSATIPACLTFSSTSSEDEEGEGQEVDDDDKDWVSSGEEGTVNALFVVEDGPGTATCTGGGSVKISTTSSSAAKGSEEAEEEENEEPLQQGVTNSTTTTENSSIDPDESDDDNHNRVGFDDGESRQSTNPPPAATKKATVLRSEAPPFVPRTIAERKKEEEDSTLTYPNMWLQDGPPLNKNASSDPNFSPAAGSNPFDAHFLVAKTKLRRELLAKTGQDRCAFCVLPAAAVPPPPAGTPKKKKNRKQAAPFHTFADCPVLGAHDTLFANCLFVLMGGARLLLFRPRSARSSAASADVQQDLADPTDDCPPGHPHTHRHGGRKATRCPWGDLDYNTQCCTIVDMEPELHFHSQQPPAASSLNLVHPRSMGNLKYSQVALLITRATGISPQDVNLFHPTNAQLLYPVDQGPTTRPGPLLRESVRVLGSSGTAHVRSPTYRDSLQLAALNEGVRAARQAMGGGGSDLSGEPKRNNQQKHLTLQDAVAKLHAVEQIVKQQHRQGAEKGSSKSHLLTEAPFYVVHCVVAPMQYVEGAPNAEVASLWPNYPEGVSSLHPNPAPFLWTASTSHYKRSGTNLSRDVDLVIHHGGGGGSSSSSERLPSLTRLVPVVVGPTPSPQHTDDAMTSSAPMMSTVRVADSPLLDAIAHITRSRVPCAEMLAWMSTWAHHQRSVLEQTGTLSDNSMESVPLPTPDSRSLYKCCAYCHQSSLAAFQLRLQHALFFYANLGCLPQTSLPGPNGSTFPPNEVIVDRLKGSAPLPLPHEIWFAANPQDDEGYHCPSSETGGDDALGQVHEEVQV